MNILSEILANKRQEVESAKKIMPPGRFADMQGYGRKCLSLKDAIRSEGVAVIAEIKKASPSKGIIREDFDPAGIARQYVAGGASAVSILTDAKYFMGQIGYLTDVRPIVPLPLLRKDFIIDSYQVKEARAFCADAVLLIAAALEPSHLKELHDEASGLGLDCLVEVHNEKDLDTLDLDKVKIIGINNRNLSDFTVDISISSRIAPTIPKGIAVVSESGIETRTDIEKLAAAGIGAVLVGESLMRSRNPEKALRELLLPVGGVK
jgi:indole-3-glycerol phosphate synthase